MSERRGTRALETWCRRLTEGYPGVKVENMTTSWRDGLAFCAIIHHFRPDLIDFSSLNKSDIYYNNSLAFQIAERHLGIPALLDAEDMVEYQVPDRLSILTYLSQFYQVFGNNTASSTSAAKQGTSPARLVPKRSQDRGMISPSSTSPPTKMASRSSTVTGNALGRREPCAKCLNPVFLAERLNVGTKLYHRTCFRCARCNNQLSLANCYETETGQYCCETCPDEEVDSNTEHIVNQKSSDSFLVKLNRLDQFRNRSLSDEEKQKGLQKFDDADEYSADFENTLEDSSDKIYQDDSFMSKARSQFLSSHLANEDLDDALVPNINMKVDEDTPPPIPKTKPPDNVAESLTSDIDPCSRPVPEKCATSVDAPDVNISNSSLTDTVNKRKNSDSNQHHTASDTMPEEETSILRECSTKDTNRSSLVKSRMLMFEANDKTDEPDSIRNKVNVVSKYFNTSSNNSDVQKSDLKSIVPSKNDADISAITVSSEDSLLSKGNNSSEYNDSKNDEEEQDFKTPKSTKTQYLSVSSENLDESDDYKLVRSETGSDSLILVSSVSDVNSPIVIQDHLDETKSDILTNSHSSDKREEAPVVDLQNQSSDSVFTHEEEPTTTTTTTTTNVIPQIIEEKKSDSILTKSLLANLSDEMSPVSIDASLLESSNASKVEEYPEDLNPFGDEEEDDNIPIKQSRQLIKPSTEDLTIITPENQKRKSTNPFGSSDEEEDKFEVNKAKPPRPPLPTLRKDDKKIVKAPKISLNPFWSDEEEPEEDSKKPVPKPRTKNLGTPEPKPRRSGLSNLSNAGDRYDSCSSLSSMCSSLSHTPGRKKKPAPPPPPSINNTLQSPQNSKQSSPCTSAQHSPKSTPKIRKNRKAPLPPTTSTPVLQNAHLESCNDATYSPINEAINKNVIGDNNIDIDVDLEKEKIDKDEKNRNRQSQSISSPVLSDSESLSLSQSQSSSGDKSTHGKWKRKKGPAPARPVPQRRQIRPLPLVELRRELDIIEMQQQGLEKQGVKLEQLIREKCEIPGSTDDTILSPEVEELVLELFELVNEKNELFRRQAELMYLRRQQRLEEEYADIEYQIRCLMERPERNKTDSDKAREEELINRLVEVVERRNEIVECLEMDRVREAEEDQSISTRLTEIATRREEDLQLQSQSQSQCKVETPIKLSKKEKKKIKKEKKLKEKGKTVDADKDIDESENLSIDSNSSKKEKKKKIWFLHK